MKAKLLHRNLRRHRGWLLEGIDRSYCYQLSNLDAQIGSTETPCGWPFCRDTIFHGE